MLALVASLSLPKVAQAQASPGWITVDGVVTDHGAPVAGQVVVVWCGDISHFGGSTWSDGRGHFMIRADTATCPLGVLLSAVAYQNGDDVVGVGLAYAHTQTTVNIRLGDLHPVAVPEYGEAGAAAALVAGGGAAVWARRRAWVQSKTID